MYNLAYQDVYIDLCMVFKCKILCYIKQRFSCQNHSTTITTQYQPKQRLRQSSQSRMNALITTLLLLSSVATLGYSAGINILPEDAATQLSRCAWRAGWYPANTRKGYSAEASRDRAAISNYLNTIKQ